MLHAYVVLQGIAAILVIASVMMKGMVRLRVTSIVSNAFDFIAALLMLSPVGLLKYGITLPVNFVRLREMLKLVDRSQLAASGDLSMDWLKPFMVRRAAKAGERIFAKGDPADALYLVATGKYRLIETGIQFSTGGVVGEMGLLTPGNTRTQGFVCDQGGDLYQISYEHVRELYYQNPEFGFYFLRLISQRLMENIARLEAELAARPPAPALLASTAAQV